MPNTFFGAFCLYRMVKTTCFTTHTHPSTQSRYTYFIYWGIIFFRLHMIQQKRLQYDKFQGPVSEKKRLYSQ